MSGADGESIRAVDDFVARLLRLDVGVEAVVPAVERHPGVAILQIYAAAANLYAQTEVTNRAAAGFLVRAETLGSGMNERERMLAKAVREWLGKRHLRAVETLEALTERWPEDLCSAKFCEFVYYVLGQHHCGERFRAHMDRLAPVQGEDPDFLGMAAFASELCGDFDVAESRCRRALAAEARNPWAHHSLTHVLIRQGRVDEGRRTLEAFLPVLATCGRPVYCHDAWHLALLYLEELDFERARRVFDQHIWGFQPDTVGEQVDAIALLWRMEMAGYDATDLWPEIAERVIPHAAETFMPFLNAHFAYALARGRSADALDGLLDSVAARANDGDDEALRVWAPVGRAIVEAAALFGSGDRAGAAPVMRDAASELTTIGGSDAQDDLFRQTYLVSLREGKRTSEARAYADKIMGAKRRTPLDEVLVGA